MAALTQREQVLAAIRGLRLPDDEREEKLAGAHPEVRKRIEAEIAALMWVSAAFLIWYENGVFDEVVEWLREYAAKPSDEQVAA